MKSIFRLKALLMFLSLFFVVPAFSSEPEGLQCFRTAYPDVSFSCKYDSSVGDYLVTVKYGGRSAALYWQESKLIPKSELHDAKSYTPLLYVYPSEILEPSSFTKEQIQQIRKLSSNDYRKTGPGMPPFFFDVVYDSGSRKTLEKHLTRVSFLGKKSTVHSLIVKPLQRIETKVQNLAKTDAEVKAFLEDLDSADSYNWRQISDSKKRSLHSLGIALDVLPSKYRSRNIYWSWRRDKDADWMLLPLSERWLPPASVIKAFEEEGFIFGGKWIVWDNMHFDYRPEIKLYTKMMEDEEKKRSSLLQNLKNELKKLNSDQESLVEQQGNLLDEQKKINQNHEELQKESASIQNAISRIHDNQSKNQQEKKNLQEELKKNIEEKESLREQREESLEKQSLLSVELEKSLTRWQNFQNEYKKNQQEKKRLQDEKLSLENQFEKIQEEQKLLQERLRKLQEEQASIGEKQKENVESQNLLQEKLDKMALEEKSVTAEHEKNLMDDRLLKESYEKILEKEKAVEQNQIVIQKSEENLQSEQSKINEAEESLLARRTQILDEEKSVQSDKDKNQAQQKENLEKQEKLKALQKKNQDQQKTLESQRKAYDKRKMDLTDLL